MHAVLYDTYNSRVYHREGYQSIGRVSVRGPRLEPEPEGHPAIPARSRVTSRLFAGYQLKSGAARRMCHATAAGHVADIRGSAAAG